MILFNTSTWFSCLTYLGISADSSAIKSFPSRYDFWSIRSLNARGAATRTEVSRLSWAILSSCISTDDTEWIRRKEHTLNNFIDLFSPSLEHNKWAFLCLVLVNILQDILFWHMFTSTLQISSMKIKMIYWPLKDIFCLPITKMLVFGVILPSQ